MKPIAIKVMFASAWERSGPFGERVHGDAGDVYGLGGMMAVKERWGAQLGDDAILSWIDFLDVDGTAWRQESLYLLDRLWFRSDEIHAFPEEPFVSQFQVRGIIDKFKPYKLKVVESGETVEGKLKNLAVIIDVALHAASATVQVRWPIPDRAPLEGGSGGGMLGFHEVGLSDLFFVPCKYRVATGFDGYQCPLDFVELVRLPSVPKELAGIPRSRIRVRSVTD